MRIVLPLLFFLNTISCYSQTKDKDYDVYSIVLNEFVNSLSKVHKPDSLSIITIVPKMVIIKEDETPIHALVLNIEKKQFELLQYHSDSPRAAYDFLTNSNDARLLLTALDSLYYSPLTLDKHKIKYSKGLETINEFYFKKLFTSNVSNWYRRFSKNHPNSLGIFEFSKVAYRNDYSCLYLTHRFNPLFGSGTIYILKKENNSWKVFLTYSLWNN